MADVVDLQVDPEDLATVREILARLAPGEVVWAFGSRVQGRARRFSDLDLALMGHEPISIDRLDALRRAFSQSQLPWRVDVIDLACAPASLRDDILRRHAVVQGPG